MTNFQYNHFEYIFFNTVHFFYSIIWYKCTSWYLIALSKTFTCSSIHFEGYFWYFVTLAACIFSETLWWYFSFVYDVTLTSFIWVNSIILLADLTWFICIYMCNIYLVMKKSVQINILLLLIFLTSEIILLFPCSLARTTDDINKSAHMVSLLLVSS